METDMENGSISIFYGEGMGKTSAAIGQAIKAVIQGKSVIVIQFMKGKSIGQSAFIQGLEPNLKWFSFEKEDIFYEDLPEEKKKEAISSIQNGMQFARKVLTTKEADVLVLDEVLGLLDSKVIEEKELLALIESMWESTELILTGRCVTDRLVEIASFVSKIEKVK